jgi:hypothetical protein
MRCATPLLALVLACSGLAAGCGKGAGAADRTATPTLGVKGGEAKAAEALGYPTFATKNTTRIAAGDPVALAAAVARAVYPAGRQGARPGAVVLADGSDWHATLAASVLMSSPVRAPMLLGDGRSLPDATSQALTALAPTGSKAAGGAQVIRIGDVARPAGLKSTDVLARDPFALARAIDAFSAAARGRASDRVLLVSADEPAFALPAAGMAAKSGVPILFTRRDELPAETRRALQSHQQPKIYVVGPSKVVSPKVTRELRRLGTVLRVGGQDPVANAIEFAAYSDGAFGWGVSTAGHGLVFARADADPATAGAAAPLSASGTYGPLLLNSRPGDLDKALQSYLLDIQPGYRTDPVRGVYNHGWILGDVKALSEDVQSEVDRLLEIVPVADQQQP